MKSNFTLSRTPIYYKNKVKIREEKRWLRHENGLSHFSFGCKTYKRLMGKV